MAAINAKRLIVRSIFPLGTPSPRIQTARDGVGKFQTFSNGYAIFWSPTTCARLIHGAIYNKWLISGPTRDGSKAPLGYPISDETDMYNGRGFYSKFQNGFIVWTAITGAHALYGAIAQKWWELVERGLLGGFFPGYPATDEDGPPGGG